MHPERYLTCNGERSQIERKRLADRRCALCPSVSLILDLSLLSLAQGAPDDTKPEGKGDEPIEAYAQSSVIVTVCEQASVSANAGPDDNNKRRKLRGNGHQPRSKRA
jgi:hypothetical protein